MKVKEDVLGNQMKDIESRHTSQLFTQQPIYARLDGKSFSKFTRGVHKPFDASLTEIMQEVTKELVTVTRAQLGYTQSDEISLYWEPSNVLDYAGRKEKWLGELVGLTTAKFMEQLIQHYPSKLNQLPRFDCRVFNISEDDAFRMFLWRYVDARKNSVNVVASQHFSVSELSGRNIGERKEMLSTVGDPWQAYNDEYKYGTFVYPCKSFKKVDKTNIPVHLHDTVPEYAERTEIKKGYMDSLLDCHSINDIITALKS